MVRLAVTPLLLPSISCLCELDITLAVTHLVSFIIFLGPLDGILLYIHFYPSALLLFFALYFRFTENIKMRARLQANFYPYIVFFTPTYKIIVSRKQHLKVSLLPKNWSD